MGPFPDNSPEGIPTVAQRRSTSTCSGPNPTPSTHGDNAEHLLYFKHFLLEKSSLFKGLYRIFWNL
jgi:hypothetical protein